MVVDDDAVVGQQLGRHRAHARRRRHGERDVHVLDDAAAAPRSGALLAGGDRGGGLGGGGLLGGLGGRLRGRRLGGGFGGGLRPRLPAAGFGRLGGRLAGGLGGRLRRGAVAAAAARALSARSAARAVGARRPGCPAGSRRRTRARPGRRWTGRRGTAGTSPRPATRWCRSPPREEGSSRRTAGMSSRLTRGRVPSSSMGLWLSSEMSARHMSAGQGWTGCRVYARPLCRTWHDRRRPAVHRRHRWRRSVGGTVRDEQIGQGVVGRGLTCVAAAVPGGRDPADVEGAGAVVGGGVDVGTGRQEDRRRSRARRRRAGGDRGVQRRPAGVGVAPVDVGAGVEEQSARASSRQPPAAACSAPPSASAPALEQQPGRGGGTAEGRPGQQVRAGRPVGRAGCRRRAARSSWSTSSR